MHDIGIIRCDDGIDWSDYLESIFTSNDEKREDFEPFDVNIFSIGRDGTIMPINQPPPENDSPPNPPNFKFVVVVVTPCLLQTFHDFRTLGFWNFDKSTTRKALFMCGIETVQLFETDESGRTLSERFKDYSSWTKYSHGNYDKLVDSAIAWIRSADPVIPGRKDSKIIQSDGSDKKENINDGDDGDSDDSDNDYIFMHKPPSDEDKSSKASSRIIRDSNSSGEIDEYIGKDGIKRDSSLSGQSTIYSDTYGIGPSRNSFNQSKQELSRSNRSEEFSIIPNEAGCEDNTTIVVIFKESTLDKYNAGGSQSRNVKIGITDESRVRQIDLNWMNRTVAYFVAPMHHPGTVQIKVISSDDRYKSAVDLEYKRSSGVEELVSEVSQIYIHLLSISFNLNKNPSVGSPPSGSLLNPSPSLTQMDRNLSNVFRDYNDIDQFNVRAFEYFFGTCHNNDESTTYLPTALHLVAKHNLPQLGAVLLGLPESDSALSIRNSSKMTPIDLARSLGHLDIATLFEEFLNSGNIDEELTLPQVGEDNGSEDQYIDMEQNQVKNPKITVTHLKSSDEMGENESLKRGAFNKSQEELLNIIDLYKSKDISMKDVQTLFGEWQLRHPNYQNKQTMHELLLMPSKSEECKGLKHTIGSWFGSGNKKSQNIPDGSGKTSKKQNLRFSSFADYELPLVPPRMIDEDKYNSSMPQPPHKTQTQNDYLRLLDGPDNGDATDTAPHRPPRRTPLKNTKQTSFPTQLNSSPSLVFPRKCSLPETSSRTRIHHFNSRLDSTTEISESTTTLDKNSHSYISMGSKGKLSK